MIAFLHKLKLIQHFSIAIPIDRIDFVKICRKKIALKETTFSSMLLEYFSRNKYKYVGTVEHEGIQIRKRKTFFSFNKNACLIKGYFRQKNDVLYLNTEIKGFSNTSVTIYVSIFFFALYFVGYKLISSSEPLFPIVFALLLEAFLLFLVPVFIIRLRIKAMKIELQQDIYNWILK